MHSHQNNYRIYIIIIQIYIFVDYLKFKFNLASWILLGNPMLLIQYNTNNPNTFFMEFRNNPKNHMEE